ncbi:GNAT family N-acetyltransferase [Streptomyces sp. NPDC093089]|uniref:GNAT family N-acetyltransferase n=1 Tax=Streptomyces sp. NPDC093089 TaxID=3366024 RepID=UPI00382F7E67
MASVGNGTRITLRPARPADGGQLAEIAREAYGKYLAELDEPPAPILLDYEKVAAAGRTYLAVEADEVLGMVTVEPSEPHLILRNLAVRPTQQGRGIGRRLVSLVEEMARDGNLRGVRLWTRAEMSDNIAFYKGLDYVYTHSEETENARRVFFTKDLNPAAH